MSDADRDDALARARQSSGHSRALWEAMRAWAKHRGGIASGGARDSYGEVTFHWDTDPSEPRAELTLWADLNEDERPVIRVSFPPAFEPRERERAPGHSAEHTTEPGPSPMEALPPIASAPSVADSAESIAVSVGGTNLPLVEPDERCEACGAQGTVGRAVRFTAAGAIHELHRFCAACWPEEQGRYEARWRHERRRAHDARLRSGASDGPLRMSTAFESATWDGALSVLDALHDHAATRGRAAVHDLRRFADELFNARDQMVGEMPFEIVQFIAQYAARPFPPEFVDGRHGAAPHP